jgi:hypothetical protein
LNVVALWVALPETPRSAIHRRFGSVIFSIASNARKRTRHQWEDEANFFDCHCSEDSLFDATLSSGRASRFPFLANCVSK